MSDHELETTRTRPPLRVDLLTPTVVVEDGPVNVALRIFNTSDVIETLDVSLIELMAESLTITPDEVTLFPDESVDVEVVLSFHRTLPSGSHQGILVVAGRSGAVESVELDLIVEVPPRPGATLRVEPPVRTVGRRRGAFEIVVDNTGNTELELLLSAADANREADLTLSHRSLGIWVDGHAYAGLVAQHRRPWTGGPIEHAITVRAEGDGVVESADVVLRQKAVFTPGIITILTLALIVLLWALAMLFGVTRALAPAESTKAMAATFHEGFGVDHLDPALVGSTVTGTVTALSTSEPLPRVTVEVFDASGAIVAATATGDDGGYEFDGVLPARYRIQLRAPGFEPLWWPGTSGAADAGQLLVPASDTIDAGDARLVGLPGALGGEVIAGDGEPVATAVEVVALDLVEDAAPLHATTDDAGLWSVDGLRTPATYRITYTASGFDPVEIVQPVGGGEQLALNPTRLPAAPGSIAGTVVDSDGDPIGGVEVVAQRGDVELATTTPTSGEIGTFGFDDLETPGTYLLTFTVDGYASETQGVRLDPGASVNDLEVVLRVATGTVRGFVMAGGGQPLGGVTVTVSGGGTVLSTDTLTSGAVGTYRVSGLPLPGVYTVSFDVEGYGRETVQVELSRDAPEGLADVVVRSSLGRIAGRVVDGGGQPIAGAEVEISDGSAVRRTTTASAPSNQRGRFSVSELGPGTYTVTATTPGGGTLTVMTTLSAGGSQDLTLRVSGP